jgi:nicotinamidase/pyrazinamidase
MKKILIIVDVQNDFCPGGSLAVDEGAHIIPAINRLSSSGLFDCIIATQDWHPAGHISFADTHGKKPFETISVAYGDQMLWPVHCVQGTPGADFHQKLDTKPVHYIIRKGYRCDIDSYSAFFENDKKTSTGLAGLIDGIEKKDACELVVAGIATDVCVFNTAIDARRILSYPNVCVVRDASEGVTQQGVYHAYEMFAKEGIRLALSKEYV